MTGLDLYGAIEAYGKEALPMHMPGHKRNVTLLGDDLPYAIDITEIDGFDDLHAPEENGVLYRIAERAATLYHAKRAFPLVSGSTGGILAAIRALTRDGDTVLVARNVHKSVYHAVELCGLAHDSLLPTVSDGGILGSVRPEDVEAALERAPQTRAVVITSPTYEGVVSDVKSIAEVAHRHGARLIVDAAHGAHLGFDPAFPSFPTEADVAITSLHKTLPALTQTALALVFSDDPTVTERVAREITVFESSSPSYVLLSSIDRCVSLLEKDVATLFGHYAERLDRFRKATDAFKTLRLLSADTPCFFSYDAGKLVITSTTLTGTELASRLRSAYRIEPEMAYTDYVLCMTSICDTDESFERLLSALREIDAAEASKKPAERAKATDRPEIPKRIKTIREAVFEPLRPLRVGEASTVYAWVYPPGIPLIVPGETVTEALLSHIDALRARGLRVRIGR